MSKRLFESRQIYSLLIIVIMIAIILVLLSYNFFLEYDARTNEKLNPVLKNESYSAVANPDERTYHIIYDEEDAMNAITKDGIENVLKTLKVKYTVSLTDNVKDIASKDYMILITKNWYGNKETIDMLMQKTADGASLLIVGLPHDDLLFSNYARKIGIYEIGDYRACDSLKITDDLVLGLEKGDVLSSVVTEDVIFDIHTFDDARVYVTDEYGIAIYYTIDYGAGKIGVYNGDNLFEKYYCGFVTGILGTLDDNFIYPIINTGIMFIDDWPGPFKGSNPITQEQYGMDLDDFLKYIWWPDMMTLVGKYGVVYTGQYVLTYNDIQKPPFDIGKAIFDIPMYSFGQQIIKSGGELGLHGYNHQPLWFSDYLTDDYEGEYEPWGEKEEAKLALNFAVDSLKIAFPKYQMGCYVPPSNIIDDKGIEVVKEVMGSPVIVSGLFNGNPPQEPSHSYEVIDDVIYLPRLTSGSFLDDEAKMNFTAGMGLYGVVSHFIHPDDAVDEQRNHGMEWEQMRLEYDKMMAYIEKRYPYMEYQTATNAANKLSAWYAMDYTVTYMSDYIKVKSINAPQEIEMILRTDSHVVEGEGYSFDKVNDRTYYVKIFEPEVLINLEGED